jgi:hypothetical protein
MVVTGGAGGLLGVAENGLQLTAMVGGTLHGVEALKAGDLWGAIQAFAGVGLSAVRGVSACARESVVLQWGQRALHGVAFGQLVVSAFGKFADGDWFGGLVDLADAGANLYMMGCFAAGTPLLTPDGDKLIEQFKVGDLILTAPEDDPQGALEVKPVEEVFVRTAPVVNLHVGGVIIRTTAEHPFWVRGKGWQPTAFLEIGDELRSRDGKWVTVQGVADSGEVTTVYNLRVAEHHTYFVGARDWGFSVWAHNTYSGHLNSNGAKSEYGIYEIKIDGVLHKIGKADMSRVTLSSGLPTRLHQQVRKLRDKYGEDAVTGKVVQELGRTTTAKAKLVETARLQAYFDEMGIIPPGNLRSFRPQL